MTSLLPGYDIMAKKPDEPSSPYLRRRLRSYEEVQRRQAERKARSTRSKSSNESASKHPRDETSRDEQDDH